MESRILIGEVSKMYGLSKQTLIHYDRIGLLSPHVNENGYRSYSYQEFEKLDLILSLKESGLTLKEIKEFIDDVSLDKSISVLENQYHSLKKHIDHLHKIKSKMAYKIKELKTIESYDFDDDIKLLYKEKRPIVKIDLNEKIEIGLAINYAIRELRDLISTDKIYSKYSHIIEGVILDQESIVTDNYNKLKSVFVFIENFNENKNEDMINEGMFVTMQHHGKYEDTYKTYRKLETYMTDNDYVVSGDTVEIPLINFWATPNEDEYITEIQIPVVKK